MQNSIFQVTLLVTNYDEALEFYTQKLEFVLIEDTQLSDTKRWVRIAPKNSTGASLLLAQPSNDAQAAYVGNQTGGRVFLFIHTDNAQKLQDKLIANGVKIQRSISTETYGKVFVFADLYGNLWDVIEPLA
jgi:catechol 2,3-dioxygenase-like lactoylglutathione lyase family enzyme